MNLRPRIILISGVPGTGKTTIGNYLESQRKFVHFDIEKVMKLPNFNTLNENTILTWGFNPEDPVSVGYIKDFVNSGRMMIWLDGNRDASKKAFIDRKTVSLARYEEQMERITRQEKKIYSEFSPRVINPFDSFGHFKPCEEIAIEILK